MKQAWGVSVPETLEEVCSASRCALILYDMQVGIVSQLRDGERIAERCGELLEGARAAGMRIFFLRHLYLPHPAAGAAQLRRAMIWQHKEDPGETVPFITRGSSDYDIFPALAPRPGEVLVDKITMSAFEGTFLNIAMRDLQLQAFIIAGIALEVGIEPTVRHALDLNYIPVLAADACGARTAELKERSLGTLAETGEVMIADTDAVLQVMGR
ncbi:MAG TPA: cysteine hydrolase [Acidobacteriaceae bacterium]